MSPLAIVACYACAVLSGWLLRGMFGRGAEYVRGYVEGYHAALKDVGTYGLPETRRMAPPPTGGGT